MQNPASEGHRYRVHNLLPQCIRYGLGPQLFFFIGSQDHKLQNVEIMAPPGARSCWRRRRCPQPRIACGSTGAFEAKSATSRATSPAWRWGKSFRTKGGGACCRIFYCRNCFKFGSLVVGAKCLQTARWMPTQSMCSSSTASFRTDLKPGHTPKI